MGVSENTLPRNQKKSMKIPWVRTHVFHFKTAALAGNSHLLDKTRSVFCLAFWSSQIRPKKNHIGLDPSPSCFGGFKYMGVPKMGVHQNPLFL